MSEKLESAVADRLRERAAALKSHIDYVKAEHAESDRTGESSWMDCVSKDDVARDEQHIEDLLRAAESLATPSPSQPIDGGAREAELREALEPFARYGDVLDKQNADDLPLDTDPWHGSLTFGHLRRARAALSLPAQTPCDREDAEKWRALRNCARFRIMGYAGNIRPGDKSPAPPGNVHLGIEFWSHHDTPADALSIDVFERFVRILRNNQALDAPKAEPKDEEA